MPSFRTVLPPQSYNFSITHKDRIWSIGSCFAENIGQQLIQAKFNNTLNPFGILYNPVSIANSLNRLVSGDLYTEDDLFQHADCWHSFDHHSRFSKPGQTATLEGINEVLSFSQANINEIDRLIITLGTAFVFEHMETKSVVANCHKLPASNFKRYRLTVNEVLQPLQQAIQNLLDLQPELQIIMTVSPVRHIKDGLVQNQLSKATLLLAVDQLCAAFAQVHYFPAYELVMDDLRDYRFFESDMIHPNATAQDYIWTYFQEAFFSPATVQLLQRIEKILRASQHRPFHPETPEHQLFLQTQLQKIDAIVDEFPVLDFSEEKETLTDQLKTPLGLDN